MTKVLIIEDDRWLADSHCAVLKKAGYDAEASPNPLDAMDVIDARPPDVLVLDVLLGGATAFSLLNELQSHTDTKAIPVVLCTNIAEQLTETPLEAYGVKRIVDKATMHPKDIVAAVKAVVG